MAMKMIDKKDCEYKGGYIVNDGKIVCIDNEIVDLFNKLDVDIQRAKWEAEHQVEPAVPTEKFCPKTEHGKIFPVIEADTPELDKMAEHAIKMMDELDAMAEADKANEYFAKLQPVIMFVNDEFIVSGDQPTQHRFDLPTVGNPLELDKDDIADLVLSMFV